MSRTDRDDRGAGLVEYALLLGLIAIVCVAAVTMVGQHTSTKISVLGEQLARDDAGTATTVLGGATTTTTTMASTTTSTSTSSSTTSSSTTSSSTTSSSVAPPPPTTIPKKCTGPGARNIPDCAIYFP